MDTVTLGIGYLALGAAVARMEEPRLRKLGREIGDFSRWRDGANAPETLLAWAPGALWLYAMAFWPVVVLLEVVGAMEGGDGA